MPSELRSPRLAVLIDADNASAKIVDGLFEEIANIGEASVRRIYGDFSNPRSKAWADTLSRYAIIPQQQFAYTTGKNASDITLVIDAMDLLHGHVGGMDVCASALLMAERMIVDGGLKAAVDARYAGWNTGGSRDILEGRVSLEALADQVLAANVDPQPKSGRQEFLENLVNRFSA